MRLRNRLSILLFAFLLLAAAALAILINRSDSLAWRAEVLRAKLAGDLPQIPLGVLIRWLAPGSPVYLENLAAMPNVNAGIQNNVFDDQAAKRGEQLYAGQCASCHGESAQGKSGPDLIASIERGTDWSFLSTVKWGRPGTAMAAQPLSDLEIWQVHAWLRKTALRPDDVAAASSYQVNVPPEALLAASQRSPEWLTYSGNYAGHRHSGLNHISRETIGDLRVAWVVQLEQNNLQATPIVAGGLMFVTAPQRVFALDAKTGERVWQHERPVSPELPLCCGTPNRGVAILGDTVYVTTLDAHLIALDAATGRKKWEIQAADSREGYTMTGAPLALKDKVVAGVAGGEFGTRGFIAAFSADDGKLVWKFNTVPGPGEFGHDTWKGESWKRGGAPAWTTGAYDSKLDLVYWGVGNPSPPHNNEVRAGDNLFSNSVVALEAKTGKLKWHFQFTPADEHDWDSAQQPILAEIAWQGEQRAVLLLANRNGFFYALDRETGQFLYAKAFVKQTWASGFEPTGRPIVRPESKSTSAGVLVWPAGGGATNWWPPSYDPARQLVYVPAVDAATIYFRGDTPFEKGKLWLGGNAVFAANHPASAAIKALDAASGEIRWVAPLDPGPNALRIIGGVLSTAGGLVFAGYGEDLFVFDSDTGEVVWKMRLGGLIRAAPVSYSVDGRQFVALLAGSSLFSFTLGDSK